MKFYIYCKKRNVSHEIIFCGKNRFLATSVSLKAILLVVKVAELGGPGRPSILNPAAPLLPSIHGTQKV